MRFCRNTSGSILMEFVLVIPILYMLIFGIIQFAYIFLAKQLTFYAAYSAARSALVYNVHEYANWTENESSREHSTTQLYPAKGPLFIAACTVLSWMNGGSSPGNGKQIHDTNLLYFPGADSDVWDRVRITGEEHHNANRPRGVWVKVHYYCPLFVPLVSDMIAATHNLSSPADDWTTVGWLPTDLPEHSKNPQDTNIGNLPNIARINGLLSLRLEESCYMAKPYETVTFARIPEEDKGFFRLNAGTEASAGGVL